MPEYTRVPCPKCESSVKIEIDDLGEWVTCPKCDKDFVAKETKEASKPSAKPVAKPRPRDEDDEDESDRPRRRRRDEDDEDDDRPRGRRRRRDEEEDEDDRRPRRPARKSGDFDFDAGDEDEDEEDDRPRRRGPRANTCPRCQNTRSTKVSYTWWGGILGPAMFGLVKCSRCSTQYVKATGKPLGALPIIIYSVVVFVIGIVVVVAITGGLR
ncbi:MAG: hypothetical protein K2V38_05920 [Gemmataceae bacterium]|nr:hypothetical protein [Gemmataceae bacterium]